MTRIKALACGAGVALALVVPVGSAAAAEEDVPASAAISEDVDALYVDGLSESKTVTPAQVRGVSITAPESRAQELPVTGGDILGLVMIGGAAIATGAVLVRRNRVTRTA